VTAVDEEEPASFLRYIKYVASSGAASDVLGYLKDTGNVDTEITTKDELFLAVGASLTRRRTAEALWKNYDVWKKRQLRICKR